MGVLKGDFIGFTFNGYHSSDLGVLRVSDGSRYSETLLPTMQDKTVQVPGADGTYYFGSFYTQRPFNVTIAYDNLSEEQLRQLKEVFGDKGIRDFIFDEVPYKIYRVKSTGSPNLKYVCFNKNEDELDRDYQEKTEIKSKEELYGIGARSPFGRVYKGEGQLNFVCYNPYARSRYKYIDQYTMQNIPEWGSMDTSSAEDVHYNLYDWVDSARLKRSDSSKTFNQNTYTLDVVEDNGVMYYNAGDVPMHFKLQFILANGTFSFSGCTIRDNLTGKTLTLDSFNINNGVEYEEVGFRINGQLNLIEGLKKVVENNVNKKIKVEITSGRNPKQEGWYDSADATQITNDTEPQSGKTYYEQLYEPSGLIYNRYITDGDFFKFEKTDDLQFLQISPILSNTYKKIEYNYLYY